MHLLLGAGAGVLPQAAAQLEGRLDAEGVAVEISQRPWPLLRRLSEQVRCSE